MSGRARILRLGAALLALGTALAGAARADQAGPGPGRGMFNPPPGPMVLMRELHRSLSDGNEIVTRRRYEIRFVPEPGGYRVDGRLLSAEADAPPRLTLLAMMEKLRSDEGLFPIHLTSRGMIIEQRDKEQVATPQTRKLADAMIAHSPLPAGERGDARGFVSSLLAHPELAGGHWPAELFHPMTGDRQSAQDYRLADGSAGRIRIAILAHGDGPGGLLQSLERTIITEAAGHPHQSRERWTLNAPGKP